MKFNKKIFCLVLVVVLLVSGLLPTGKIEVYATETGNIPYPTIEVGVDIRFDNLDYVESGTVYATFTDSSHILLPTAEFGAALNISRSCFVFDKNGSGTIDDGDEIYTLKGTFTPTTINGHSYSINVLEHRSSLY